MRLGKVPAAALVGIVLMGGTRADQQPAGEQLTLAEAMALAREANLDVRLARERLAEAAGAVKSERATLLPELEGTVTQTRQDRALGKYGLPESATATIPDPIEGDIRYNAPDAAVERFDLPTKTAVEFPDPFALELDYSKTTRTYDWFDARLRLKVPIIDVQNFREYKAKTAAEERARRDVVAAEEKAMNAAATVFLRICLLDASIEEIVQRIELIRKRVAYYEDQHASGLATALDVSREKHALMSAETDHQAALTNRRKAERELLMLIGWEDDTPLIVEASLGYSDWQPPSPQEALEMALSARADLLAQREMERAARLQRDAARADQYPTLMAVGAYGREGERISDTVDTWLIGALINVPIWDSFGRQGRLEQRASQFAQTQNRTESLQQSIVNEVQGSLDAIRLMKETVALGRNAVKLAEENLNFRKDQEAAGVAGPMDVNSAEMELLKARYKEQEALFNYSLSKLSFWTAVGDVKKYLDPSLPATESTTTREPSQTE